MKNALILILKGFVIGIGKIMPGVSGAVLAIGLGVYEKAIEAVSNFGKKPFFYGWFLGCLGLGSMISISFFSDMILWLLDHYYLPMMLLFIGLMMGGITSFQKELRGEFFGKHLGVILVPILLIVMIYFSPPISSVSTNSFIVVLIYFVLGFLEALTMIIPGISGTALFMMMGCYTLVLELFASVRSVSSIISNFSLLCPFGMGLLIGVLLVSKVMNYFFHRYQVDIYYMILTFSFVSIFVLFLETIQRNYSVIEILFGILCLVIGYVISYFFESKNA